MAVGHGNQTYVLSAQAVVRSERLAILLCNHTGQVEALMHSIDLLEHWLVKVDTDPNLRECMVEYAKDKGASL
jgi:hypothetical protein